MASHGLITTVSVDDDFLFCAICSELFKNAKLLSCLHSFCECCLRTLVEKTGALTCPICRRTFQLPHSGVTGLRANVFVNDLVKKKCQSSDSAKCEACKLGEVTDRCLDCAVSLCMTCSAAHKFIPATRTHRLLSFEEYQKTKSEDPASVQPPVYCDRHLNHPETFYCDSCETPICLECTVLDHPKPEHRYRYLKEAASEFTEYLSEVTQELKARESEAIQSKTAIQQKIESLNGSYRNTQKKLSDHVTRTVKDMTKRIQEDGENLARVLNDEYENRRVNLRAELKQVECIEDSLVHVRDFAERLVRQGNDSYLMSARNEVMSQTQELRKVNAKCQPTQDDYLDFSPSSDFCEAKTVGRLQMERPENHGTQSNDQAGMERSDIKGESTLFFGQKMNGDANNDADGHDKQKAAKDDTAHINADAQREVTLLSDRDSVSGNAAETNERTEERAASDEAAEGKDVLVPCEASQNYNASTEGQNYTTKNDAHKPSEVECGHRNGDEEGEAKPEGDLATIGTIAGATSDQTASPSEVRRYADNISNIPSTGTSLTTQLKPENKALTTTEMFENKEKTKELADSGDGISNTDTLSSGSQQNTHQEEVMQSDSSDMLVDEICSRQRMESSLKQGASKSTNKTQRDTSVEYQTIGPKGLIRKFGGIGSGVGQLKGPWGVTMSKSGDLIVGDTGNKRLLRSTMKGEFRKTIEFPDFQRSFKPEFSAVSADGNIFTTDAGNKQVVVCDEDGKLVKCFGKGELRHPRGIAVSPINGNVYVVDTDADSVFIYRPDGDHIKTFGRQENADARLSSPWCVAIDYNGNVFVSNCGNHTIKVYSANGDFLFSFGSLGSDNGQFYHPEGIATDMYGYVYVCDCWNNRVQKFDLYGSFEGRVDSPAHHLRSPVGICVNNGEAGDDPFGQVIVVEQNSGQVKVFRQKIEQVEYI